MNKNKLVNNQYRKQEFNKRRKFRGAESFCKSNGDCPIFQNCLLEIDQLTNNWNELKKIVEKGMNSKNYIDGYESVIYEEIYDRMNEIKERKNEK